MRSPRSRPLGASAWGSNGQTGRANISLLVALSLPVIVDARQLELVTVVTGGLPSAALDLSRTTFGACLCSPLLVGRSRRCVYSMSQGGYRDLGGGRGRRTHAD